MSRSAPLLVFLVLLLASGCAYLEDRGRDFLDCFQASVDAGVGLGADARVGPLGIGSGYWTGYSVGLQRKAAAGLWRETAMGFPLTQVVGAIRFSDADMATAISSALTMTSSTWVEHRWVQEWLGGPSKAPKDLPVLPLARYHLLFVVPDFCYPTEPDRRRESWTDSFWIEGSVRVFLGVRAGFNPAEFLDFLLGWFGVDIAGDDIGNGDP